MAAFDNGFAALEKRLMRLPDELKKRMAPVLEKSANEVAELQRTLAPVETGALRASITVTPAGESTPAYSQPGGSAVVPEGAVRVTAGNSEVRYAALVEHGHSEVEPRPYFWPAYRHLKDRILARNRRAAKKIIADIWGGK